MRDACLSDSSVRMASSSEFMYAASQTQIGNIRMLSGSASGSEMTCRYPSPAAPMKVTSVESASCTSISASTPEARSVRSTG